MRWRFFRIATTRRVVNEGNEFSSWARQSTLPGGVKGDYDYDFDYEQEQVYDLEWDYTAIEPSSRKKSGRGRAEISAS